jgi:hypothetical protein
MLATTLFDVLGLLIFFGFIVVLAILEVVNQAIKGTQTQKEECDDIESE